MRCIIVLEDDALGGHGSRGYGKIKFEHFEFHYRNYQTLPSLVEGSLAPPRENKLDASIKNTSELLEKFSEIQALLPGS